MGSGNWVVALKLQVYPSRIFPWLLQTTVLSLRLVLAEDVLNITSRLNFPVVEAASFQLKVRLADLRRGGAASTIDMPCLTLLNPGSVTPLQMTGPSLVPFDLSKQNAVLTQLVTELTVTAGVHNMRIVQVSGQHWKQFLQVPEIRTPSTLPLQVDAYSPLSGTTNNVTITVIADYVTNNVADFGQVGVPSPKKSAICSFQLTCLTVHGQYAPVCRHSPPCCLCTAWWLASSPSSQRTSLLLACPTPPAPSRTS